MSSLNCFSARVAAARKALCSAMVSPSWLLRGAESAEESMGRLCDSPEGAASTGAVIRLRSLSRMRAM